MSRMAGNAGAFFSAQDFIDDTAVAETRVILICPHQQVRFESESMTYLG